MAVLYRKYRPQVFSEVVGQEPIVTTLVNALRLEKVAHAYLFTGGRGTGKTTVARVLARAMNCLKLKAGEACLACAVCTAFDKGAFLDMVEIDAASNTGVDNVRELIEHARFRPSLGRYKVFIIDETHMLSKGAFNALLKTLEEPPEHVVFILATTELSKVPATIVSRTQRFDFKRFNEPVLASQLEKIVKAEKLAIPKEVIGLVARAAGGGMRDALSLLDKVSSLGDKVTSSDAAQLLGVTSVEHSHALLSAIVSGKTEEIPPFFDRLLEAGVDSLAFNRDFLEYLRSVMLEKLTGDASGLLSPEDAAQAKEISTPVTVQDIILLTKLFLKSYKDLQNSPDELPLLVASIEAALKHSQVSIGSIAQVAQKPATVIPPVNLAKSPGVTTIKAEVPPRAINKSPVTITLEQLLASWPAVCDAIKASNGPLAMLVKNSPLRDLRGGIVYLGVKFLFHKEHLESGKNQALISSAIETVTGQQIGVKAEIVERTAEEPVNAGGVIGDALKIFGGELVD